VEQWFLPMLSNSFYAIAAPPKARHNCAAMLVHSHLGKDVLGYQIHTNRELGMMLRREKPLAVFCDVIGAQLVLLRYLRMFDRHVVLGTLIRREFHKAIDIRGECRDLLAIFYALPEETWRIDAMIELRRCMDHEPWTEEHERLEGSLLGYTNAQNDAWIARRHVRHL
jgi:hypothetical protein